MVKVKMPMGAWEVTLFILRQYRDESDSVLVGTLVKDIEDQVYSQEY